MGLELLELLYGDGLMDICKVTDENLAEDIPQMDLVPWRSLVEGGPNPRDLEDFNARLQGSESMELDSG